MGENVPFPPVTVGAAHERLMASVFDFIGGHYHREIRDGEVDIGVLFTNRIRCTRANTVVLVTRNQPNRDLANAFDGSNFQVHQIGDVQGRNNIRNAIHSGALLGRTL